MKHRNPIVVILLSIVTLGIYSIYWQVKTKLEMNRVADAKIPTAWLLIIPLVNIWWLWKYSQGVDKTTGGKISAILSFVLLFLLGVFGMAIVQFEFNKVGDTVVTAQPEPLTDPAPGFGAPVETSPVTSAAATVAPIAPTAPVAPTVSEAAPTNEVSPTVSPVVEQPTTETAEAPSDPSQAPTQQV